MQRVRNSDHINAYINKRQFKALPVDPDQIRRDTLTNEKRVLNLHQFAASALQDQSKPWWQWLLTLKVMSEAHKNSY